MVAWYPKERLGDLPAEAARRWDAREALVCDGKRWTYREFDREVNRVAKGLMALGVETGEHVALWMNNRPEWLFLTFAIAKVGAVLVPLNTRYRTDDVAYTVRQSDSGTWISVDRSGPVDYAAMLADVLPGLAGQDPRAVAIEGFPRLRRLVVVGESDVPGTVSWEAMLAGGKMVSDTALAERAEAVDPDEPVMIGYTSGTTGHPKGVLHTHLMIRNMRERANRIGLTFEDVIVNPLPLFHMYGFSEAGLIAVIAGCKHVLLGRFDADECMRLVEAERGTITHGFDTHYKEYLDSLERTPRDVSSLRFGTFPSGMTSSARIARRVQAEMVPTFTGWGMTETFTFATMSFGNSTPEQRSDASGYPAPGFEIKVVDQESGQEVAVGEEGELLIRGLHDHPGLLQEARGDRRSHRPRRLAAHRRHRGAPRRRAHPLRRPLQGPAEGRRRERVTGGGRGLPDGPRSDRPGGGGGLSRRAAERGRRGLRCPGARQARHQRGDRRLLQGPDRELQEPASRAPGGRLPHDRERQGAEAQAPQARPR